MKTKRVAYVLFIVTLGFIVQNIFELETGVLLSDTSKNTTYNSPILNVYTWVDYLDPEIVSDFEKEFHVKVHVDYYDDEDIMFSLVQSRPERYDIIFPTDYMVDLMMRSNLLSKLDMRHVPNQKNIKAKFRTLINKKWKGYCVTIDCGGVGIAYNTKYVKCNVDSWGIFWDAKYKGRMALVSNGYEVMSVGQKLLGYPLNPTNPKDMDDALKLLKNLKPLLQGEGFMSYDKIRERLLSEELWLAECYNADAAFVNQENNAVKFVIPKEGTGYWVETIAVPVGARNKRLAEEFINFMLRPENGARHTNYSHYANCNKKAWVFVNKETLRNPYVYINRKTMAKLEVFEILNPDVQKKYNECWASLLSN
ncbi:MAG TPA: ABC transporter substrate-binding protein [Candidatus Wunengus sp. YC60]|uniref:ABC transporter substrate-binding protein n=1 Tax=Candidatus Wunengus sp. YC60 TaxID=3367697 RepID=UPI0040280FBE